MNQIQINHEKYEHPSGVSLLGRTIREIGGISREHDLFAIRPGRLDKKITDDELVEIRHGQRFFSIPRVING